jgi:hypothetical protein
MLGADMVDGASTFNANGPKCEGINCTHRDHQVGTDPEPAGRAHVICKRCGYFAFASSVCTKCGRLTECPHGIGTDDECSRCARDHREVHR